MLAAPPPAPPPPQKRPAGEDDGHEIARKSKKGGARSSQHQGTFEVHPDDFVQIVPVRRGAIDTDKSGPVLLSKTEKASALLLSEDRLSVTGHKGYRSVRSTHGAHEGTWYCEVGVAHLGASGHVRLGWTTKKADVNAPVGFDAYGIGFRDVDGSKVHKALREPYGAAFKEGDVVGLLLHLPPGGRPREDQEVVRYKGSLYMKQEKAGDEKTLPGSLVGFSVNGAWQGAAWADFAEGTYYPTASLYTMPDQAEGATVTFNFGPLFKHGPPTVEGVPPARPLCELSVGVGQQQQGQPGEGGQQELPG